MPTSTTRPRGRTMASEWVSDSEVPTQSKTTSAPSVSRPASTSEPDWRRTARASWSGATTVSAPSRSAVALLVRVLGPDHHRAARDRADHGVQGSHHGQAQGAGPDHGHRVPVGDAGRQDGVDGTGGGLDHHGVLVGEVVGDGVELGGVGRQAGVGPAPAGVGAEPGLEAGFDVAEGHVAAQPGVPLGALGAERDGCGGGRSRGPAR